MTARHLDSTSPPRRLHAKPPALHEPAEAIVDDDPARVIERPDGFHWIALDGRQEFGPFETRARALADMAAGGDTALATQSLVQEVERELGIADWIDPDTGAPAEGGRPPRLDQD
jgi:hypothetical protein